MAGRGNLLQDFRIIGRVLADRKEDTGRAFLRQRLQDRGRIDGPGAIVERQHHFMVAQEIELLEVLETKPRSARGVNFNDAGNPKRIGICARGFSGGCGRRGSQRCLRGRRALGGRGLRPGYA